MIGEHKFIDALYRAYSSPMELVRTYIKHGRFKEFVQGFMDAEAQRKKAEDEKNKDWMLWLAYVNTDTDMSFGEYKQRVTGAAAPAQEKHGDADLTDDGIRDIVQSLFPM